MAEETGLLINYILAQLFHKITVPTEYHNQVKAVKEMLKDDVSGVIDSLTDFMVESASVDINIEASSDTLSGIFKRWLDKINIGYLGRVPMGIKPLLQEYLKERWKSSSFPILNLAGWEVTEGGLILPTKMFFVDGESIYTKENPKEKKLTLFSYDYYLGQEMKIKLDQNVIITKPYSRWAEQYPVPYLIKRGVYHNFEIIKSLKNKETEILDQIIPYLLLIKKGTERLAIDNKVNYTNDQLQEINNQMQALLDELKDTNLSSDKTRKTAIRTTQFDETMEHLIPDLSTIFKPDLFSVTERHILAGLGFIDVEDAVSTSRRESILNPKGFITEVQSAVEDFKGIIKDTLEMIKIKNDSNVKYNNMTSRITSSPIYGFMTDKFKERIRQLYDRGLVSRQTTVELIGETEFKVEVDRVKKESREGLDFDLYPPVLENREGVGIDIPGEETVEPTETEPTDDKQGVEKQNYNRASITIAECIDCGTEISPDKNNQDLKCPECGKPMKIIEGLVGAPYSDIKALPKQVKNRLDTELQRIWMRIFNNAYETYDNDTIAFKVAWNAIKRIAKEGKSGKLIRKAKRVEGKLQKAELDQASLEEAITEVENETFNEVFKKKKFEIAEKQNQLLAKLLKGNE